MDLTNFLRYHQDKLRERKFLSLVPHPAYSIKMCTDSLKKSGLLLYLLVEIAASSRINRDSSQRHFIIHHSASPARARRILGAGVIPINRID